MPISASRGTRIVNDLLRKGLIKVYELNLCGRGRSIKLLELTDKAYEAINAEPKPGIGRGAGFVHGFCAQYFAGQVKGIEGVKNTTIEGRVINKSVDVLIETEQERIGIEIAMSAVHEKVNIAKDLSAGLAKVFIACNNKAVQEEVRKVVDAFGPVVRDRIKICLIHQVVGEVESYVKQRRNNG